MFGACAGSTPHTSGDARPNSESADAAREPSVEALRVERVITHTVLGQTIESRALELRHGTRMITESEAVGVLPAMTMLWDFGTQTGWIIDDELQQFAAVDSSAVGTAATRSSVAMDLGLSMTDDGAAIVVPDPVLQPSASAIPGDTYGPQNVVAAMRVRGPDAGQTLELWVVAGLQLTSTDYANAWRRRLPAPRTADEERFLGELEALPGYPAVVRTRGSGQSVVNEVISVADTQVAVHRLKVPKDYQQVQDSAMLLARIVELQGEVGRSTPERSDKTADSEWTKVLTRPGDDLHFYLVFQDAVSTWQCENKQCRVVHGHDLGRSVELPCLAASHLVDFSSASKSGRWLVQGCEETVHVLDMRSGKAHATDLGEEWLYAGVIDDDGTATVSFNGTKLARIPRAGAVRTFSVKPPRVRSGDDASVAPAHAPWLGFSEGAYSKEVGWREGSPLKVTKLGGGAFFNGSRAWVSLMEGGYVELGANGETSAVTGRFGGGLGGKGFLMGITAWGDRGLLIEYESAALLLDGQLETVLQVELPAMDGMLHVGVNPQGSQMHAGSPYGALYVRSLPADVVARSSAPSE